jgi:hypothetical protein
VNAVSLPRRSRNQERRCEDRSAYRFADGGSDRTSPQRHRRRVLRVLLRTDSDGAVDVDRGFQPCRWFSPERSHSAPSRWPFTDGAAPPPTFRCAAVDPAGKAHAVARRVERRDRAHGFFEPAGRGERQTSAGVGRCRRDIAPRATGGRRHIDIPRRHRPDVVKRTRSRGRRGAGRAHICRAARGKTEDCCNCPWEPSHRSFLPAIDGDGGSGNVSAEHAQVRHGRGLLLVGQGGFEPPTT